MFQVKERNSTQFHYIRTTKISHLIRMKVISQNVTEVGLDSDLVGRCITALLWRFIRTVCLLIMLFFAFLCLCHLCHFMCITKCKSSHECAILCKCLCRKSTLQKCLEICQELINKAQWVNRLSQLRLIPAARILDATKLRS